MRSIKTPLLAAALLASACGNKAENKAGAAATSKPTADVPAPTGNAIVSGVVKLDGPAPAPEPWSGAGNADCKSLRGDTMQLVKAKDGKLADVFVYVKAGLPKGTYPTPAEPVVFDQHGCEFSPRVFGVMSGQPIAMGNSDKLMHNVKSPEFNQGFPFGVKRTMKLNEPAVMATIKCDVHPWMRAYAGVMEHPYFAVTNEEGAFEIKGLVEGTYTLEAWHEKLGTREASAKASTSAAPVEITFKSK